MVMLLGLGAAFAAGCSGQAPADSAPDKAAATPSAPVPPLFEGAHDKSGCGEITGWAWDRNHPDAAVSVDIMDGDSKAGSVAADRPRQDLATAGVGTGKYGFVYAVPASLKDGQSHVIRVVVSGSDAVLRGSPRPLQCNPTARMYEGAHDTATCDQITGWARDSNHADQSLSVDILDNGKRLQTVAADQLRGDLAAGGVGSGRYGFVLAVPDSLKDGRAHAIEVVISGTDKRVLNTPKSLTCGR